MFLSLGKKASDHQEEGSMLSPRNKPSPTHEFATEIITRGKGGGKREWERGTQPECISRGKFHSMHCPKGKKRYCSFVRRRRGGKAQKLWGKEEPAGRPGISREGFADRHHLCRRGSPFYVIPEEEGTIKKKKKRGKARHLSRATC